jgi:predicted DNA-binding transcriptional regulator YafY
MTVYGMGCNVASHTLRDLRYQSWFRALSRPALYRIQYILAALLNGETVTTRTMSARLEVSPRTIARDIDYLINTLHVPLFYDTHKHTYVLNGPIPVLFAPHSNVTEGASSQDTTETQVVLCLDHDLVAHFSSVSLHPSQRLESTPSGDVRLHLTVHANDALVQWVMSYGGRIRVLSPQFLRDRIYHLALSLITQHQPLN